jgi:hypothetical protein
MLAIRSRHIPRALPEAMPKAGTYLTDGQRLFRVIRGFASPIEGSEGSFALLEDCRTFEAHPFTPSELWSMELRRVGSTLRGVPEPTQRSVDHVECLS